MEVIEPTKETSPAAVAEGAKAGLRSGACAAIRPVDDAGGTLGREDSSICAGGTLGCEADTATGLDPGAAACGSAASARPPDATKLTAADCASARDFEKLLRLNGFSKVAARKLAGGGWSALAGGQPGDVAQLAEAVRALADAVRAK